MARVFISYSNDDRARAKDVHDALENGGVDEALIARRLLRFELAGGLQRVELTHDRLTVPVQKSRQQRVEREATERLSLMESTTRPSVGDPSSAGSSRIQSLVLWNRILVVSVIVLLTLLAFLLART